MTPSRFWNRRQAVRIGLVAAPAALLLWPIYALVQQPALPLFVIALAVTAASGLSILAFTTADIVAVQRSRSVLPARMFDLALGAILALPSSLALTSLFGT